MSSDRSGRRFSPHVSEGHRLTRKKLSKQGVHAAALCHDDVAKYFNLPADQACRALGVSLTVLKRVCRRLGIERWPFRRVKSLERIIEQTTSKAGPKTAEVLSSPDLLSSTVAQRDVKLLLTWARDGWINTLAQGSAQTSPRSPAGPQKRPSPPPSAPGSDDTCVHARADTEEVAWRAGAARAASPRAQGFHAVCQRTPSRDGSPRGQTSEVRPGTGPFSQQPHLAVHSIPAQFRPRLPVLESRLCAATLSSHYQGAPWPASLASPRAWLQPTRPLRTDQLQELLACILTEVGSAQPAQAPADPTLALVQLLQCAPAAQPAPPHVPDYPYPTRQEQLWPALGAAGAPLGSGPLPGHASRGLRL